jgi:hypothetical protein
MNPLFQLRVIEVNGHRYLLIDDVAAFVRELGGGEETDVRNRLNEAADQLLKRIKDAQ